MKFKIPCVICGQPVICHSLNKRYCDECAKIVNSIDCCKFARKKNDVKNPHDVTRNESRLLKRMCLHE